MAADPSEVLDALKRQEQALLKDRYTGAVVMVVVRHVKDGVVRVQQCMLAGDWVPKN